jgi:2-dehydro-3-deoxyphosphogluconate aldolase/(4S)-4-hydroxy-2-oxoglutarate aldolase
MFRNPGFDRTKPFGHHPRRRKRRLVPANHHPDADRISDAGLIAVIRAGSAAAAVETGRALRAGGVAVLEVALTTPDAATAIAALVKEFGSGCLVGAGTVVTPEQAMRVIDAGAAFVFAPNLDFAVIETVLKLGRVMVPGALSPTEIWSAWRAGSHVVKLFPAGAVGPSYIKDIHGPFPGVRLTPTGGVTLENIPQWFAAGAVAVGVGSNMVGKELVNGGRWAELTQSAARYVAAVKGARR